MGITRIWLGLGTLFFTSLSLSSLSADNESEPTSRTIYDRAVRQHEKMDSYIARLQRRTCERGELGETEVLQFKYRKEPHSIHFKWIGSACHGREILWVEDQNEGKLTILLAAGDMPLMKAGKRLSLSPTSPLVRAQNPHHIREAGMTGPLEKLGQKLAQESKDPSTPLVEYLGRLTRPEYPYPLDALKVTKNPHEERCLPKGGYQTMYFDPEPSSPSYGLPVVFVTHNHLDQEVQYACYDRLLYPIHLDDADFNPTYLWGKGDAP